MIDYKKDFPVFDNNEWLVFFDSGASSQKPQYVIDWVSDFVSKYYANIHRWDYNLSEKSEEYYNKSKEAVWKFVNCSEKEVIYWYNSTHCLNLIASALCGSNFLWKWDKVLIGMWEHHSNILPWASLQKIFWFEIDFIKFDKKNYDIDWQDFEKKYDDKVKVVSINHVSNVSGQIYDVKKIWDKLREETFFIIDGSQSVPSFKVDFEEIGCDSLIFTGHKMMSYTWIWALCLKKKWIRELEPLFLWGGTVKDVDLSEYKLVWNSQRWEAGTPNIIWAVSLLKTIEYIEKIWGIETIHNHEIELWKYFFEKFSEFENDVDIVGSMDMQSRIPVFSFTIKNNSNFNKIGEDFASKNIAIRCGGHCAYPLHKYIEVGGTCRASMYLYNTKDDIDKFFEVLSTIV